MSGNGTTVTEGRDEQRRDLPSDEPSEDAESQEPTEEVDGAESEELSLDVVFEVLKNQRRRHVLRYLREEDGVVQLGDLAEHIAAEENDKSVAELSSKERKRVYVGLYQCHLPKMDDMGIVSYNQNRGLVELTDSAEQVETYLDATTEAEERPWPQYYGAVAAVGLLAFVGLAANLAPAWVSSTAVLGVVGVAFAACAAAHFLSVERTE